MCRGHGQQLAVAAHLLDEVVDVGEDAALRSGVSKRSRTRDALRRLTIVERSEREQRLEGARACVCVCVCVCVRARSARRRVRADTELVRREEEARAAVRGAAAVASVGECEGAPRWSREQRGGGGAETRRCVRLSRVQRCRCCVLLRACCCCSLGLVRASSSTSAAVWHAARRWPLSARSGLCCAVPLAAPRASQRPARQGAEIGRAHV